jgi:uncharacterized membrane protein YukC
MMDRFKEFKWAAMVGASVVAFLFSTFATVAQVNTIATDTRAYVNDKHDDVISRLSELRELVIRMDDRERRHHNK